MVSNTRIRIVRALLGAGLILSFKRRATRGERETQESVSPDESLHGNEVSPVPAEDLLAAEPRTERPIRS
jgi:hypothetical protein